MQAVKAPRYTTPLGVAQYPWLVEPDTKFNPDGDYKVNMLFAKWTPELKYIVNDLNQMLEEYYQAIITDPKYAKNASKIQKADIWEEDCDGDIVMKFKQKAIIKSIKGTHEVKIPIFDSKGKPLSDIKLGGGSHIKLCFSAAPYYVPSTRMCGLSLRPVAVQVIELKEWAEGGTMQAYGFKDEDGYEGEAKDEDEDEDEDHPFEDFTNDPVPDLTDDDDDPRTGANQF